MIEEDDDYQFSPDDISSPDEMRRRWAVISISKEKLAKYEDMLLERYAAEPYNLRRHIVRALGNIGTEKSIALLMDSVARESGLILGEIAEALGKLKAIQAIPYLHGLESDPLAWVVQKARWALRQLGTAFPPGNKDSKP